jgi:hypothetical protein
MLRHRDRGQKLMERQAVEEKYAEVLGYKSEAIKKLN